MTVYRLCVSILGEERGEVSSWPADWAQHAESYLTLIGLAEDAGCRKCGRDGES